MPPHGEGRSKERKRNRPPRTKQCLFCKDHLSHLDYKDVPKVRKLINDRGKMLPRRVTGHCAKHQRLVTVAIKRARHVALIPYVNE